MSQFSSVQFSRSVVSDSTTPWITAHQASLSITNSRSLFKLMSIELVMPSSHLILCHPLLLLPPISPSIRVFSNELTLHMRWPKYWSFSFSISPSNEHPGLISFRINWLDLLAAPRDSQESSPTPWFKCINFSASAFFTVQLSHLANEILLLSNKREQATDNHSEKNLRILTVMSIYNSTSLTV